MGGVRELIRKWGQEKGQEKLRGKRKAKRSSARRKATAGATKRKSRGECGKLRGAAGGTLKAAGKNVIPMLGREGGGRWERGVVQTASSEKKGDAVSRR